MICDTTFLIDLLRGDIGAIAKFTEIEKPLIITSITEFELLKGIARTKNKLRKKAGLTLLHKCFVLELNRNASRIAANISAELTDKGLEVTDNDCFIAGTLFATKQNQILTRNVKHFDRIEGLDVVTY